MTLPPHALLPLALLREHARCTQCLWGGTLRPVRMTRTSTDWMKLTGLLWPWLFALLVLLLDALETPLWIMGPSGALFIIGVGLIAAAWNERAQQREKDRYPVCSNCGQPWSEEHYCG